MNFNNLHRIYLALMAKRNPGRRLVSKANGIKVAMHALLQRGSKMRTHAPDHSSPVRDMRSVYDTWCGKRKRLDSKGATTTTTTAAASPFPPPVAVLRGTQVEAAAAASKPMENPSVCTS